MVDGFIWMAVRRSPDTGREWPDPTSCNGSEAGSRKRAADIDTLVPKWAADNPVVRFAWMRIAEVEPATA